MLERSGVNCTEPQLRVLLVEDDPDFRAWVRELCADPDGGRLALTTADTLEAALETLASARQDLILLDLELPDAAGLEGLDLLARARPLDPIVVLTGTASESLAITALDRGAQDFVAKEGLTSTGLQRVVRHAVARARSERRVVEAEQRLRMLTRASADLIATFGREERCTFLSRSTRHVLGLDPADFVGRRLSQFVVPADAQAARSLWASALRSGRPRSARLRVARSDGSAAWFEVRVSPPRAGDDAADPDAKLVVFRDLADQVELEEQLANARRRAAFGQLARGIAHDFAALLGTVAERTAATRTALAAGRDPLPELRVVADAVERGISLADDLLSLGCDPARRPEHLSPSTVLDELRELLEATFAPGTEVEFDVAPDCPRIRMDRTELDRVLTNLVLNAREAVGEAGRVRISAQPVTVGEAAPESARAGLSAGRYVAFAVRDDGRGMTEEARRRAVDPLFTTKRDGRATGLGLSTVAGVVADAEGALLLDSQVGLGTEARVLFPVVEDESSAPGDGVAASATPVGSAADASARAPARVLVVEDRRELLSLTCRLLEMREYTTRAAGSSDAARRAFEDEEHLTAILCDLHVDETTGLDLIREFRTRRPQLPAVLYSGYTEPDLSSLGAPERTAFLAKPFTAEGLDAALRRVIAG